MFFIIPRERHYGIFILLDASFVAKSKDHANHITIEIHR